MSHRTHKSRRCVDAALLRLVAALAVMLLAVLPHATLAASLGHSAAQARPVAAHHGAETGSQAPCHGEDAPAARHAKAMPFCCMFGCALIASASDDAPAPLAARWRTAAPVPARLDEGLPPEPAERPPRGSRDLVRT